MSPYSQNGQDLARKGLKPHLKKQQLIQNGQDLARFEQDVARFFR